MSAGWPDPIPDDGPLFVTAPWGAIIHRGIWNHLTAEYRDAFPNGEPSPPVDMTPCPPVDSPP